MKRLLTYLKRHPLATLFAPLFKMLEASFELFVPLVVAKMIDIGIYQKNAGYLWRMGALLVLLGIIGFGFAITAQYFAAKSAVDTAIYFPDAVRSANPTPDVVLFSSPQQHRW